MRKNWSWALVPALLVVLGLLGGCATTGMAGHDTAMNGVYGYDSPETYPYDRPESRYDTHNPPKHPYADTQWPYYY